MTTQVKIYIAIGTLSCFWGLVLWEAIPFVFGCMFFLIMELRLTERDIIKVIKEKKHE